MGAFLSDGRLSLRVFGLPLEPGSSGYGRGDLLQDVASERGAVGRHQFSGEPFWASELSPKAQSRQLAGRAFCYRTLTFTTLACSAPDSRAVTLTALIHVGSLKVWWRSREWLSRTSSMSTQPS